MVGFPMDFTVAVTGWTAPEEKTWETLGESRMIIFQWYRMHLLLAEREQGTLATLSIAYLKPLGILGAMLCFLFGRWYSNWCLNQMLNDTKITLEKERVTQQWSRIERNNDH